MHVPEKARRVGASPPRMLACAAALLLTAIAPPLARAQDKTLYLDRLPMAGGPEDGIAVWRPRLGPRTRFYGQLGLGFARNPLRVEDVVGDARERDEVQRAVGTPVTSQLVAYATVGVELLDRLALQVELPAAVLETGHGESHAPVTNTTVDLQPAALMDVRLDARGILLRSRDRAASLGIDAAIWLPTGNAYSYGGDGAVSGLLGLAGELDLGKVAIALDAGVQARPHRAVDDLRVGAEARVALGAFAPLGALPIRLGAEVFGSTGLEGTTAFHAATTPLEWMLEVRAHPDAARRAWVGLGAGTRLTAGYSPDLRVVGVVGYAFEIDDTRPRSPRGGVRPFGEHDGDRDYDLIPDSIDLCPDEPEDHQPPFPDDGCPGLPDKDQDGIPDAEDACPTVPGKRSADPKRNGCPTFIDAPEGSSTITILKQIEFETGKATILPKSFPILDEILKFLEANPDVARLDVEGHTDDRGPAALNERLSKDRADSVRAYLVQHGIAERRLTAAGFGPHRPIADNGTPAGRQRNRRVDFTVLTGEQLDRR